MPSSADRLSDGQIAHIRSQPLFFVATAAPTGRVNLSPKGMDTLRVLTPNRIVWLSLSGSGNETAAHLLEDSRMTLMFCAFEGKAGILRAYGTARAVYPGGRDWPNLSGLFPDMAGTRQIFDLTVDLVQTSCGTGVPVMRFERQRGPDELLPFYDALGADGVRAYWGRKNAVSLDGRPTGISTNLRSDERI
ncbi:pyridoxamine 5'-phosphate oxidase family protein [Hwanghaeella grinnelliae]|uniref:Pyridoxamine 5'-phosphate oxidase family protein n=2 Tax=Hwanghaeella grinnelliae TaxID=2500179 RepID=A0A3S3UST6_9PROT|nr:pyridoxamine 5'-phosphate oxidase family protein [Hwanghaeella grinnelliae]